MESTIKGVARLLENVSEPNYFWLANGERLKNLEDLASALEKISNEIFSHHVNENKNDFCCWIKDCIGDILLVETLAPVKSKTEAAKKIKERIKQLHSNLNDKSKDTAPKKVNTKASDQAAKAKKKK